MKVLVCGINQWGTINIYIASRLYENQRPTPFSTNRYKKAHLTENNFIVIFL